MKKQEILDRFRDINEAYNDSSRYDSLSRMLDELLKEQEAVVRCKDCKNYMTIHCTCDGWCISDDWFCADGER